MNKENTLIPELRFPEFENEDTWKAKPLEEICTLVRGPFGGALKKEIFVDEGFAVYEQSHAIYGDFSSFRYRINEEKYNELKRFSVKPGDLIMSCSGTMGKFAMIPKYHEQGVINQALLKLTVKKNYDNFFVKISLETEENQNKLLSQSAGGAIKNVVAVSQIRELELAMPSLLEQQKIANSISSLDEVIEAHIQRLDLLNEHKRGLMQNLFPQKGEKKPKQRFLEFENDGEWIQTSLGKVYKFYVTNSFSRDNLNYETGSVKNIHYGDIHTKFRTLFDITNEDVPFINEDVSIDKIKEDSYCVEGDVIFADASEDLNDIGKSIEIVNLNGEKLVSGLHTLLARQKKSQLAIGFGGYLFKSAWIRKQIQRESQGAKVLGISATRISEILISFPKNKKEQRKIASCLSALDELIASQTKNIDQLRLHKKGLMQSLFPKMKD